MTSQGPRGRKRVVRKPGPKKPRAPKAKATAVAIPGVSLRTFAERMGCSYTLVQKAVRKERLTAGVGRDAQGRPRIMDVEAADAQWRAEKIGEKPEAGPVSLTDVQIRATNELARKRQLENRVRRGQLIEARVAKQESFRAARIVRDSIMNVPARISADLASETDARRVQNLLEAELRQALATLADLLEAETEDAA